MSPATPSLELIAFVHETEVVCALPGSGSVTIGRDVESGIRLDHPSVSRQHAVLHMGPPLRIEDLGSANGTFVRSHRPLKEGEETHRLIHVPNHAVEIVPGDGVIFGFVATAIRPAKGSKRAAASDAAAAEVNDDVVAAEPAMLALYKQAGLAAQGPISVLVLGETGVGKEVLARFVHRCSPRAAGPFLGINCAALSESLLESELFGHEKGAFTGAVQAQPGLFEAAQRGTLFLDEVGELPLTFQAKLLRVLEERAVLRVGARSARPVDFRVVSATNRDLEGEVAKGTFRGDLFFRLNGFSLTIPPLRERGREVAPLARAFLAKVAPHYRRAEVPRISAEALAALQRHSWPGNLRELRNVIERALVLCDGPELLPEHLPPKLVGSTDASEKCLVDAQGQQRQRILDALTLCGGNQSRAAKMLGISRRTLVTRLDAYGLVRPRKGQAED